MNIGLMRSWKNPSYVSKLISIYSSAYGLNVIYFRPKDVDVANKKINGKILVNDEWINVSVEIPKFIDVSPFCFKNENKHIMDFLRSHTKLSDHGLHRKNKKTIQNLLLQDEELSYLVIPTINADSYASVKNFIDEYEKIILKPIGGQFGLNVYYLEVNESSYVLKYDDFNKRLTEDELIKFFNEDIHDRKFIAQKYIDSTSVEGYPFDCRINMEKDINGNWVVARRFIRIGIGQSVVSNISQGGAVGDLRAFLKANYSDEIVKKIIRKLNHVSKYLPARMEKIRNADLMILGIDIGIDKTGEIYLFEVNSAPGTSQLRAQSALLRAQYYKYILDQIGK